jgi:hypothetical protein
LKANGPPVLFRPDTDALREGASKMPRRNTDLLRRALHANVCFEQADRMSSESQREASSVDQ